MANGYSKLTGKKRDIRGYRQLYLASDHLLLVDSTRFAQEYRKFALADIQAIVTTARPPAVTMRVVMAILMAVLLGIAFLVEGTGGKATLAMFAAIPFGILILDIARGPRCVCKLCTEVSTEVLPLTRESKARAFLAKLAPAIQIAQGGPLDMNAVWNQSPNLSPQPVNKSAPLSAMPLLAILTIALLVNVTLLLCGYQFKKPDLYVYFASIVLGETVIGFFALRLLRDQAEEFAARSVSALSMVLSIIDMLIGISLFVYFIVQVSEISKAGGDVNSLKWYQISYLRYWTWYAAGWRAICGLVAGIRFVASRFAKPAAAPFSPPPIGGEPSL